MVQPPQRPDSSVTLTGLDGVLVTIGPGEPGRDEDFVDFPVEISGRGIDVKSWVPDLKGQLAGFVSEIAEDWKGESGNRSWQSIEQDLTVDVARGPLGHVSLLFTLRGGTHPAETAAWTVTAEVRLEAGEQITTLAADLRAALSIRNSPR